ncbi:tyrosine--tRNA ligase [Patescibacteria group bacterium]|nr:tyrosine--tRNA ligase [Patescibacteria group bacterium]MBU4512944.1 tyrosine--tRNA ligase [Patescibacteria group bacterium]MCG2688488.1 tyrosine--tRNA ligase [Candidatus Parcubacteria bacterium]
MNFEQKFQKISENLEEILTPEDLKLLIERDVPLRHYIGFEISGKIHIGTGLATMLVVKDLQEAGVDCLIFLADWHTWLNHKLGGDRETIKKVAVGYFKEGLKMGLKCVGGDPEKIKFVLGSDLYHHNDDYWTTFVKVCKELSLARVQKSLSIAGRQMGEGIDFGILLYPPLQVTDIFGLKVNLAHGGTDQRKAHVLMREVGERAGGYKAVALHNHLLLGLGKPPIWPIPQDQLRELWTSLKMSKSKPNTCVFIHDSPEEIREKIKNAFCPPKEIEFNSILDWTKHLIFPIQKKLDVKREIKYGGDIFYNDFATLEKDYQDDKLFAQDLKDAVADAIVDILMPARQHFSKGEPKKMFQELEELLLQP